MERLNIEDLNLQFEGATPQKILEWVYPTFGARVAATSSFQTQSVPLLHIISQVAPGLEILFLDTGFHFPETLAFRDQLIEAFGLNVRVLQPEMGHSMFRRQHGDLYRRDPDLCCYVNKVEPLEQAKRGLDALVSGIRRDQTSARSQTPMLQRTPEGKLKICPMVNWMKRDVWQYIHDHDLPTHPLLEKGYLSIGCAPCTQPVLEGQNERAGRWAGSSKTECGLHLPVINPGRTPASGTST